MSMILDNWQYFIIMQCGGDIWALHGERIGHPTLDATFGPVSTPVEFDEENMTIKTYSGSIYRLGRCAGILEQQKQYIREDVERKKE